MVFILMGGVMLWLFFENMDLKMEKDEYKSMWELEREHKELANKRCIRMMRMLNDKKIK